MNIDKYIKQLAEKFYGQIEELTREQFEEALRQAIESGDFMRFVVKDIGMQPLNGIAVKTAVKYIPYAEKMKLDQRIKALEEERHIAYSVLCMAMNWAHDFDKTGDDRLLRAVTNVLVKMDGMSYEEADEMVEVVAKNARGEQ